MSVPHDGHVASPNITDDSITTSDTQTGHENESPSGVRDEIVMVYPGARATYCDERRGSPGDDHVVPSDMVVP